MSSFFKTSEKASIFIELALLLAFLLGAFVALISFFRSKQGLDRDSTFIYALQSVSNPKTEQQTPEGDIIVGNDAAWLDKEMNRIVDKLKWTAPGHEACVVSYEANREPDNSISLTSKYIVQTSASTNCTQNLERFENLAKAKLASYLRFPKNVFLVYDSENTSLFKIMYGSQREEQIPPSIIVPGFGSSSSSSSSGSSPH